MCIFGNSAKRQGINAANTADVDVDTTSVNQGTTQAANNALQSTAAIYRAVYPTGTRRTLVNPSGISKAADTAAAQLTPTTIGTQWSRLSTAQKQQLIARQGALAA